jgi:hypothetical protein
VPSLTRIVSSPSSSPAFCLQGECPPFNLTVGVCFRHANTTALNTRTQRSLVPASRPNIQPQENQQDACVALAYPRESSPCSVLTFYPHKIGLDSSLTPATFSQRLACAARRSTNRNTQHVVDWSRVYLEIAGAASGVWERRSKRSARRLCLPRSSPRTEKSTCRLTHRHLTAGADHTGLVLSPKVFGHSDVPSARHPRVR